MSVSPVCPRCGGALVVKPGSTALGWCHLHAAVTPLHHPAVVAHDTISAVTADARVPAWVPDPMPPGWAVTGLAWGGEPGARAIVVACAGPAPLGAPRPPRGAAPRAGAGPGRPRGGGARGGGGRRLRRSARGRPGGPGRRPV